MWRKFCNSFVTLILTLVVTLVLRIGPVGSLDDFDNNSTAINEINNENEKYLNLTVGNSLWTSLVKNCYKNPSMECVEKNMFNYLQDTLDYPANDFQFTSFLKFVKNSVNYQISGNNASEEVITNNRSKEEAATEEDEETKSPLEEISRALHDKSVKFLMTHDMEVQLPETMFDGTILKISPRSLQEDGTTVKFEVLPTSSAGGVQEGRLFKKIKKAIGEKLIFALMAILLVLKLLAAKFMFFMPAVVGAVTAKKLLIKVLLFIFPFLSHLFKLCAYAPHGAKFHHHHHKIQHLHHIAPGHGPPVHHGHHHDHGPPHHSSVEVISPHAEGPPDLHGDIHLGHHEDVHDGPHWHPPSLHHHVDLEPPHKQFYNPHEQELEYYSGGPALTHHFINHRHDPSGGDDNEVKPWGQAQSKIKHRPSVSEIESMIRKAEKEALIKERLQEERLKIQQENAKLQEQLSLAMKLQGKLRQQTVAVKNRVTQIASVAQNKIASPVPSQFLKTPPAPNGFSQDTYLPDNHQQQEQQKQQYILRQQQLQQEQLMKQQQQQQEQLMKQQQQEQLLIKQQREEIIKQELIKKHQQEQQLQQQQQQQQQPQQSAIEQALNQAASITYDPFYSPILDKIDDILVGLGLNEEPCKERLICSMYKNPTKFSPHSNLLSAELSRDSKELQKPTTTNAAVIRFYRYVQAARDGQDKRECLRLYPACSINTEQ